MANGDQPHTAFSFKWLNIVAISICLLSQVSGEGDAAVPRLTEEALKQYDGSVTERPIYLAINGTIFDVSTSPAFYGPGGHYRKSASPWNVRNPILICPPDHFTGKDASRAWISECWDTEAQLTWRMDGLEAMFMPKYLDEQMQQAADGEADIEGAAEFGHEELARMAKLMLGKFGKVSGEEMLKRRIADREEAEQRVRNQLAHWVQFFAANNKYPAVGEVVFDREKPAPPELCEEALKKRPQKGGRLDDILSKGGGGSEGIFGGGKMAGGMKQKQPGREEL